MAQITFTNEGQPRSETLNGARITIGRAPDNVIVLDKGTVSGHHAEIAHCSGSFMLRDLNSSNGTRVNGTKIAEVTLTDGDEVIFGSVICVFADPTSKTPASPQSAKRKDQSAYRIVVMGVFLFVPILLFVVKKRIFSPLTRQFHPATPEIGNARQVAAKLDANASYLNTPPTDDKPHGGLETLQQAAQPPQNSPNIEPRASALNATPAAPQLSTAVVATLAKEDVESFVLKYCPSYNKVNADHLLESLWEPSSGYVKSTIRDPHASLYIVLSKSGASPSAAGLVFPVNKSGWILIPPEIISRLISPDKPVSEKVQTDLKRFNEMISAQLFAFGDCRGLLQLENGNGMRIDIKEDLKSPESLIFKTTLLQKGTYNVADVDPKFLIVWPNSASIKTVSHGKSRTDGWSTFETPRYKE
jgi:hypothetical protein